MARNLKHDLLATPDAEEGARQRFVLGFKRSLEAMRPGLASWYQEKTGEEITPEKDRLEVANTLYAQPDYCVLACLRRQAQQMMWQSVQAPLAREQSRISGLYDALSADPLGSLTLNPQLTLPETMSKVSVHMQPGGYCQDTGEQDVMAGALYEAGGAVYSQGQQVGTRESKADLVIRKINELFPDVSPRRILDMACSAGGSTIPYSLAYPDADVHGIDVAPAMLRYAHGKAEALKAKVHFSQQDVGKTHWQDESFDLVVSHNALHEMSQATQQAMFAESYRLLKPGGICVHQDVPLRFDQLNAFQQAEFSFDEWFNNEPHWMDYGTNDCLAALKKAGFSDSQQDFWLQSDNSFRWYVVFARKHA